MAEPRKLNKFLEHAIAVLDQ